jgi:ribosomal-protein-alanine N-acetyltransferase
VTELRTERLLLRRWTDRDRAAFHALNSDPAVMATIGPVMSRSESDAFMNRIEARFDEHGYGLWCVDLDGEPIGFTGLAIPWFRDGVEVGWRLRSAFWGRGYAPEAARACMEYGFEVMRLDEIISFTARTNTNSQRVMQKLGMTRDAAADFDHPGVPEGSPLRPHVLYRLTASVFAHTALYGGRP